FELAEFIRDRIAPSHRVHILSNCVKLVFSSDEIVRDLAAFGVVPRKSKTLEWPSLLPDPMVAPFLLGYFDGDGSLSTSKGYPKWMLYGNESFLVVAKEKLTTATGILTGGPIRPRPDRHVWMISANSRNA